MDGVQKSAIHYKLMFGWLLHCYIMPWIPWPKFPPGSRCFSLEPCGQLKEKPWWLERAKKQGMYRSPRPMEIKVAPPELSHLLVGLYPSISPIDYSYVRVINHSYWSCVHQLSYRFGAPHRMCFIYYQRKLGSKTSELRMKCNAVTIQHITIQNIVIHHTTVHHTTIHRIGHHITAHTHNIT